MRALEFDGGFQRSDGRLFVAVVHDLDGALGLFAQLADVAGRERRVAAVDVTDDIGIGLQHHLVADQVGARNGRTAGVNDGLDAVLAAPVDMLLRFQSRVHRAEPDLADHGDAGAGEFRVVLLAHRFLRHRSAGHHFGSGRAEVGKRTLRRDRESFHAYGVLGPARQVHLARGYKRSDAPVHARV